MPLQASQFLDETQPRSPDGCVVLFGDQRFLKLQVLEQLTRRILGADDDLGPTRFEGSADDLKFADVLAELSTRSMWGDRRMVVIDNADGFVSNHRAALEKYAKKPTGSGVLVLIVDKWPSNTKLYKIVDKEGLSINCERLKGAALKTWVKQLVRSLGGGAIDPEGLDLLLELSGHDMGLLHGDISKIIDSIGEQEPITYDGVVKLVGGWKADTTFRMLRFLREGNTGDALRELEYLIRAGEDPHRILGGMQFVYRKLAVASDLMRQGRSARDAVGAAGVFPNERQEAAAYLDALGPRRRARIYEHFLTAQLALRGVNPLDKENRMEIERLLIQLAPTRNSATRRMGAGS